MLKMACPDLIANTEAQYDDVYSEDMDEVATVSKLLRSALRTRGILKK